MNALPALGIEVKYLGWTDYKPARISLTHCTTRKRKEIEYHSLNGQGAIEKAVNFLNENLGCNVATYSSHLNFWVIQLNPNDFDKFNSYMNGDHDSCRNRR